MIASHYAKHLPKGSFTAMTRLDHNRALAQISLKLGVPVNEIEKVFIWGNHSPTMVPDITSGEIHGKKLSALLDKDWIYQEFMPTV